MVQQPTQPRPLTKTAVFYSLLALGDVLTWNVVNNWLTYFYLSENELVPTALFSAIMFFNGAVGVLLALPVGYWSDRTRSRWGRRLPFLFFTGIPRLVFFVLLWMPPLKTNSMTNVLYLVVVSLAHEVISGIFQIANKALLPELAQTDQERVKLSAWGEGFLLLGVMVGSLAGALIERYGYANTALVYAVAGFLCFYLPLFVVRETPYTTDAASEPVNFRENLSLTLRNRTFLLIVAIHALITICVSLVQTMFPFIVTQLLGLTMGDTVYFYVAGLAASLLCYPLITWLAARYGPRPIFFAALLGTALVLPGLLLLGGWLPGTSLLVPGLVWVVVQSITLAGAMVLQTAFIAEVVDYDARQTGQRREGAYYAALGFADRIVYAVAGTIPSLLLLVGRGTSGANGIAGVRLVGVVGGVLMLVALLLFRRYPVWDAHGVRE